MTEAGVRMALAPLLSNFDGSELDRGIARLLKKA